MQVIHAVDDGPEGVADLMVLGVCLGIEIDGHMHRIKLTDGQWQVLAQSATRVARECQPGSVVRFR